MADDGGTRAGSVRPARKIAMACAVLVAVPPLATGCSAVAPQCTGVTDLPYYEDVEALTDDAATILIGTVAAADWHARYTADEERAAAGEATVYSVDVSETIRGDAAAGEQIELWESCTVETRATELDPGSANVLFFANELGALVGQHQGRLAEQTDGTFRADAENLDTPVVAREDLASLDGG